MKKPGIILAGIIFAAVVIVIFAWVLTGDRKSEPAPRDKRETFQEGGGPKPPQSNRAGSAAFDIREDVKFIISPEDGSTGDRLRRVSELSTDLTEDEINALLSFISTGANSDIEYVIKNNILNKLRSQQEQPSHMIPFLIDVAREPGQDIVVRSYALQHLRPWYEKSRNPDIAFAMHDLMKENRTEISGVALLALRYLYDQYPEEFDADEISRQAITLASDPATFPLSRISALQVASMMAPEDSAEIARTILSETDAEITLRLSAIAALGNSGGLEDLPRLEELWGESRLQHAVTAAIQKIKKNNL